MPSRAESPPPSGNDPIDANRAAPPPPPGSGGRGSGGKDEGRRRKSWRTRLRLFAIELGVVLAVLLLALALGAAWLVYHPEHLRPVAERVGGWVSGRPLAFEALEINMEAGTPVIEARDILIGETTVERVVLHLTGMNPHAEGYGVLLPSDSAIRRFSAAIELSFLALPRLRLVEAEGTRLVITRRERAEDDAPLPFDRVLTVPRNLYRLGLGRLVVRDGWLEYRGLDGIATAGRLTGEIETRGDGLALRGALSAGDMAPNVAYEGELRHILGDDWEIDLNFTGDEIPMPQVRTLTRVLEPDEDMRALLRQVAGRTDFEVDVRLARDRFENIDLDFAFVAREGPAATRESGEDAPLQYTPTGLRFTATARPSELGVAPADPRCGAAPTRVWTLRGEVDWSHLPLGDGAPPSPFDFRWSPNKPGSLWMCAGDFDVPLLAALARWSAPDEVPEFVDALGPLRPAGRFDHVIGSGNVESFRVRVKSEELGFTLGEARVGDANAEIEFANGEWRVRMDKEPLSIALPSVWSAPLALELNGEVVFAASEGEQGWGARTAGWVGVATADGALRAEVAGGLRREGAPGDREGNEGGETPLELNLFARLDEIELREVGRHLPDRRGEAFTRWYRGAILSGRFAGGRIEIHGDPRHIPFRDGGGTFEVWGTAHDVELAYAQDWPTVLIGRAQVHASGPMLTFDDGRGTLFNTALADATAHIDDVTRLPGRVQASFDARGPASDLLRFVRESPLGQDPHEALVELRADGPATTSVALDIPYGRPAEGEAAPRPLEVSGEVGLGGVAVRLTSRRAVLDEVRGALSFDTSRIAGDGLRGSYREEPLDIAVDLTLAEGLRLDFAGDGDAEWFETALNEVAEVAPEDSGPWLSHLNGRTAWSATYDSRSGATAFRSDLATASVDFPAPFGKPAGTARALEMTIAPEGEEEDNWRLQFDFAAAAGTTGATRAALVFAETGGDGSGDGVWSLARGAIALGEGTPLELPPEDRDGILVTGRLPEVELEEWLARAATGGDDSTDWLEHIRGIELATERALLFGEPLALARIGLAPRQGGDELRFLFEGTDLAGEIVVPPAPSADNATSASTPAPMRVALERLHFPGLPGGDDDDESGEGSEEESIFAGLEPQHLPPFRIDIESFRISRVDLGTVRIDATRNDAGLVFSELAIDAPDFKLEGSGDWLADPAGGEATTRIEATLDIEDLDRLLEAAKVKEEVLAGGEIDIRIDTRWPGSPADASLDRLSGTIELDAKDGRLPEVPVGPFQRLFALLSLDALPRILSLELSPVFGKGLAYEEVKFRSTLNDGIATVNEFGISASGAEIDVSGTVNFRDSTYDQRVSVTPRLTRNIASAPVWSVLWPILFGNFVIETLLGDDTVLLDRLFRLRYRLEGSWDDPEVERLENEPVDGASQ